jgi:hypothetical protein
MTMMKAFVITALSMFVLSLSTISNQASIGLQITGKLRGRTLDITGAVIPNAPIAIEGDSIKHEIKSNHLGRYEIELPPGQYRISARISGFQEFLRAPFAVRSGETSTINIIAEFGKIIWEDEGAKASYDSLQLSNGQEMPMEVVIKYVRKRENEESTIYEHATFSYEKWLVHAAEIILDRSSNYITAKGKVLLDDGRKLAWGEEVQMEITSNRPKVRVIK